MEYTKLGEYISRAFPDGVLRWAIDHEELTVWTERSALQKLMAFLRDNSACLFKQLMDVCGVDYPQRNARFDVVYHLLSLKHNGRIRVIVTTDEKTAIPSVTELFSAANWWEREVWDMFGIAFDDHPDLRRILTDYNFEGHPLRKDFPLTGYVEVRYDQAAKRVVYEPVKLDQNFRNFDFMSPWEGMTDQLKQELANAQKAMDGTNNAKKSQNNPTKV